MNTDRPVRTDWPATTEWKGKAAELADTLVAEGKLSSPGWIAAVRGTPRHRLVPSFFEQEPDTGQWREVSSEADGLERIYSNTGVYTKIGSDPVWGHTVGLSSTRTPSLVTRTLETLDVREDHRVLEIGTGTGYTAALLCHRLGDHRVTSVDIDPDLVDVARSRLDELGHRPALAGRRRHRWFPRPRPLRPDPRDLLRARGPVVLDRPAPRRRDAARRPQTRRGRGQPRAAAPRRRPRRRPLRLPVANFMPLRTGPARQVPPPRRDRSTTTPRPSTIGHVRPWEDTVAWFLASLTTPTGIVFGHATNPDTGEPGDLFCYTPDGSWCEVSAAPDEAGRHPVWEGGPEPLWQHVERARTLHQQHGHPGWERLGATATPDAQWIWLDDPTGVLRELP